MPEHEAWGARCDNPSPELKSKLYASKILMLDMSALSHKLNKKQQTSSEHKMTMVLALVSLGALIIRIGFSGPIIL